MEIKNRYTNATIMTFDAADLRGVDFRGADLSGAIGLPDVPVIPEIDQAILTAIETGPDGLDMEYWHDTRETGRCQTTHCRAGWAIHLAGPPGYDLENRIGPCAAGALIYAASRPGVPVPDFHATNEAALTDLHDCAASA